MLPGMQVLVALTVGLVFWLVAWSFGVHAFAGFLVTVAIVVGAAVWQIYGPAIREQLGKG